MDSFLSTIPTKPIAKYSAHNSHKPLSTPQFIRVKKAEKAYNASPKKIIASLKHNQKNEIPNETTNNFGIYYKNYKTARKKTKSLTSDQLLPIMRISVSDSQGFKIPIQQASTQTINPTYTKGKFNSEPTDRYVLPQESFIGISQAQSTRSLEAVKSFRSQGMMDQAYKTYSESLEKKAYQDIIINSPTPNSSRKKMISTWKKVEYRGDEKFSNQIQENGFDQKKINYAIKTKLTKVNSSKTLYEKTNKSSSVHKNAREFFDNVRYHKNLVINPFKQLPPYNLG